MKVFTNNKATGHYPVGFAAVIVAETAEEAAMMLDNALLINCLPQTAKVEDMIELPTDKVCVKILVDGNY